MPDLREPKDGLIVSLHIPKTAGTYFGSLLKKVHGDACALYYGPASERTHPALRVPPRELTASHLNAAAEAGVKIVHGHLRARYLIDFLPRPQQYYVVLREPIEHTISHYHYQLATAQESRLGKLLVEKNLGLEEFLSIAEARNHQYSFIKPFALEDFGFVGVTELIDRMLPLVGLAPGAARSNENRQKPMVDLATRQALIEGLGTDLALYSQAMELAMRRLGSRREAPAHRLKRRVMAAAQRLVRR